MCCLASPECEGSPKQITNFSEIETWNNCIGEISFDCILRYEMLGKKGWKVINNKQGQSEKIDANVFWCKLLPENKPDEVI